MALSAQDKAQEAACNLLAAELDADLRHVLFGLDWRRWTMLEDLLSTQRLRNERLLLQKLDNGHHDSQERSNG